MAGKNASSFYDHFILIRRHLSFSHNDLLLVVSAEYCTECMWNMGTSPTQIQLFGDWGFRKFTLSTHTRYCFLKISILLQLIMKNDDFIWHATISYCLIVSQLSRFPYNQDFHTILRYCYNQHCKGYWIIYFSARAQMFYVVWRETNSLKTPILGYYKRSERCAFSRSLRSLGSFEDGVEECTVFIKPVLCLSCRPVGTSRMTECARTPARALCATTPTSTSWSPTRMGSTTLAPPVSRAAPVSEAPEQLHLLSTLCGWTLAAPQCNDKPLWTKTENDWVSGQAHVTSVLSHFNFFEIFESCQPVNGQPCTIRNSTWKNTTFFSMKIGQFPSRLVSKKYRHFFFLSVPL